MRRAFTLIELLVVIGIIAILTQRSSEHSALAAKQGSRSDRPT